MNSSFQTTLMHLMSQTAALYLILLLKETLMNSCIILSFDVYASLQIMTAMKSLLCAMLAQ